MSHLQALILDLNLFFQLLRDPESKCQRANGSPQDLVLLKDSSPPEIQPLTGPNLMNKMVVGVLPRWGCSLTTATQHWC